MKDFIESLSLTSGAGVIAGASVLVTALWLWLRPGKTVWLVVFVIPVVLSFCLYWAPVWLGASPVEYSSWVLLFLVAWSLAGAVPSSVLVFVVGRCRG